MSQKIAFVSDMHIAPDSAGALRSQSLLDLPPRRKKHLVHALDQVRQVKPEAVFLGGDNTNQAADAPGYAQELFDLLELCPRPWKIIPGNHDVGPTVGWHHHDPEAMKSAVKRYREIFGMDYWVHEAAGFQVIGINSQIFGSSLQEAEQQTQWLHEVLSVPAPPDLIRCIFFHTPPYLKDWDDQFTDGSEMMCLKQEARQPLKDILFQHPPDILITGHAHRFWIQREHRWWWVGLPATALPLSEMDAVPDHLVPSGTDQVGWVSLERDAESWKAEFHPLFTESESP